MANNLPLILTRDLPPYEASLDEEDTFIVVTGNEDTVRVPWSSLKEGFLTTPVTPPEDSLANGSENQLAWDEVGVYTYYNGMWGKAPRVYSHWEDYTTTSRFLRVDASQGLSTREQQQGRDNLHIVSATTLQEGLVRLANTLDTNDSVVPTAPAVRQAIENALSRGSGTGSGDLISAYIGEVSIKGPDNTNILVYDSEDKDLEVGVGATSVTFKSDSVKFYAKDGTLITEITRGWNPGGVAITVDQDYSPASANPQSGTAVAQAVADFNDRINASVAIIPDTVEAYVTDNLPTTPGPLTSTEEITGDTDYTAVYVGIDSKHVPVGLLQSLTLKARNTPDGALTPTVYLGVWQWDIAGMRFVRIGTSQTAVAQAVGGAVYNTWTFDNLKLSGANLRIAPLRNATDTAGGSATLGVRASTVGTPDWSYISTRDSYMHSKAIVQCRFSYKPRELDVVASGDLSTAIADVNQDISTINDRLLDLSTRIDHSDNLTVDDTYSPESAHPQAGTAVAEAIEQVKGSVLGTAAANLTEHADDSTLHISAADREKLDNVQPSYWQVDEDTGTVKLLPALVESPVEIPNLLTDTVRITAAEETETLDISFNGMNIPKAFTVRNATGGLRVEVPSTDPFEIYVDGQRKFWVDSSGYGPQQGGGDSSAATSVWTLTPDRTALTPVAGVPNNIQVNTLTAANVVSKKGVTVGDTTGTSVLTLTPTFDKTVVAAADGRLRVDAEDITLRSYRAAAQAYYLSLRTEDGIVYTSDASNPSSSTTYPLRTNQYNQHIQNEVANMKHLTDSQVAYIEQLIEQGGGSGGVQYWTRNGLYLQPFDDTVEGVSALSVVSPATRLVLQGARGTREAGVYIKGGNANMVMNVVDNLAVWWAMENNSSYAVLTGFTEYPEGDEDNPKHRMTLYAANRSYDRAGNARTGLHLAATGEVKLMTRGDYVSDVSTNSSAAVVLTAETLDEYDVLQAPNVEAWGGEVRLKSTNAATYYNTTIFPEFKLSEDAGFGNYAVNATVGAADVQALGGEGASRSKLLEGLIVKYNLQQEAINVDVEDPSDEIFGLQPAYSIGGLWLSRYCGTGAEVLTEHEEYIDGTGQTVPAVTRADVLTSKANLDAGHYATLLVGTKSTIADSNDLDESGDPIEKTVASTFLGPVREDDTALLNPASYGDNLRPLHLIGSEVRINGALVANNATFEQSRYFKSGPVPLFTDPTRYETKDNKVNYSDGLYPWNWDTNSWQRMVYSTDYSGANPADRTVLTMSAGSGEIFLRGINGMFRIECNSAEGKAKGIYFNPHGPITTDWNDGWGSAGLSTTEIKLVGSDDVTLKSTNSSVTLSANTTLNAASVGNARLASDTGNVTVEAGQDIEVRAARNLDLNGDLVRINGRVLSKSGGVLPQYIEWDYVNSGQSVTQPDWISYPTIMIDCTKLINKFYNDGDPDAVGGAGKVTYNADFWEQLVTSNDNQGSTLPMPSDTDDASMEWTLIFLGPTAESTGTYYDDTKEYTLIKAKKGADADTNGTSGVLGYNMPEVKVGFQTMTVVKVVRHKNWVYGNVL